MVELPQPARAGVVVDDRQGRVLRLAQRLFQVHQTGVDVAHRVAKLALPHAHPLARGRHHLHDAHRTLGAVLGRWVQPRLLIRHRHRQIFRHAHLAGTPTDDLSELPLLFIQRRQKRQVRHH